MNRIFAFVLLCGCGNVLAQEIDMMPGLSIAQQSQVLTNVADEYATCSAYYQIVSECVNNTEPGKGDGFERVSLEVMQLAVFSLSASTTITLADAGKTYDEDEVTTKSAKTIVSWFNREKTAMQDEILTCQNISLLLNKHMEPCNEYFNDAGVLMKKWTEKVRSE